MCSQFLLSEQGVAYIRQNVVVTSTTAATLCHSITAIALLPEPSRGDCCIYVLLMYCRSWRTGGR